MAPINHRFFLKHLSYIKTDITDSYGLAVTASIYFARLCENQFKCALFANINSTAPIFQTYSFKANLIKILNSYQTTLNMLSKMQTQMKNLEKSQIGVNDEYLKQAINSFKLTIKSLFTKL